MKLTKDDLVRLPLAALLALSMVLGGVPSVAWAEAVEEATSAGDSAADGLDEGKADPEGNEQPVASGEGEPEGEIVGDPVVGFADEVTGDMAGDDTDDDDVDDIGDEDAQGESEVFANPDGGVPLSAAADEPDIALNSEVMGTVTGTEVHEYVLDVPAEGDYTLFMSCDAATLPRANEYLQLACVDAVGAESILCSFYCNSSTSYESLFAPTAKDVHLPAGAARFLVRFSDNSSYYDSPSASYQGSYSYHFKVADDDGDATLCRDALSGTNVLLEVRENGCCAEDEGNDGTATANHAPLDVELTGTASKSDQDWYVFDVPDSGDYTLMLANDGGQTPVDWFYAYVYDASRQSLLASGLYKDGVANAFEANSCVLHLESGITWVQVYAYASSSSASSAYRVKLCAGSQTSTMSSGAIGASNEVIGSVESEPNDVFTQANVASVDMRIKGHLSSTNFSSFDKDKEDWLAFEVPSEGDYTLAIATDDGTTYHRYSSSYCDVSYALYSSERAYVTGNSVRLPYTGGVAYATGIQSTVVHLRAGVAWLRVHTETSESSSYFEVGYHAVLRGAAATVSMWDDVGDSNARITTEESEPNDTLVFANVAPLDTCFKGQIATSGLSAYEEDRQDWYVFDVSREGDYTLLLATDEGTASYTYDFYGGVYYSFYDSNRVQVASGLRDLPYSGLTIKSAEAMATIVHLRAGTVWLNLRTSNHKFGVGYHAMLRSAGSAAPMWDGLTDSNVRVRSEEAEPNDTFAQANVAPLNAEVTFVRRGGDDDIFAFEVPAEGDYTLSLANDGGFASDDTLLVGACTCSGDVRVLDNDRKEADKYSSSYSEFASKRKVVHLGKGRAYLHVRTTSVTNGGYCRFRFRLSSPGASMSMSSGLIGTLNVPINGFEEESNDVGAAANLAVICDTTEASVTGSDVDWYAFRVPEEGDYALRFFGKDWVLSGGSDARYKLRAYDDGRSDLLVEHGSSTQGVYVKVDQGSPSTFKLHLKAGVAWMQVALTKNKSYDKGWYLVSLTDADVASAQVAAIPDKPYTGSAIRPAIVVKMGNVKLVEGTDYVLDYRDNVNVGTASIVIKGNGQYGGTKTVKFRITKATNPITAKATKASISVTYKPSAANVTARNVTVASAQGAVAYANASTDSTAKKLKVDGKTGKVTVPKGTKAGAYAVKVKATAAGNANYAAGSATASYEIVVKKAANPLTAKAVARTASAKKLKSKAVTVARPLSVSKAQGKVTYAKVSKGSAKCLAVNKKTGKATVRKGTKKGTYKVKVKVTAAGNKNYKSGSKTVTCKVTVK